jgi:hypothetical protein
VEDLARFIPALRFRQVTTPASLGDAHMKETELVDSKMGEGEGSGDGAINGTRDDTTDTMDGTLNTCLDTALDASLNSAGDCEADDEVECNGDVDMVNKKSVSFP